MENKMPNPTKMHCPVCGAKLLNDRCQYCKDVTLDRILESSNERAKDAIKVGLTEEVVYTNYLPNDVNKKKLWIFTVLLGWLGIHNLYVGKRVKGLINVVAFASLFFIVLIQTLSNMYDWGIASGFNMFATFFEIVMAAFLILWFNDIVSLLFKKFKVPVILGEIKTTNSVKTKQKTK